jgi:hypothetical protein
MEVKESTLDLQALKEVVKRRHSDLRRKGNKRLGESNNQLWTFAETCPGVPPGLGLCQLPPATPGSTPHCGDLRWHMQPGLCESTWNSVHGGAGPFPSAA